MGMDLEWQNPAGLYPLPSLPPAEEEAEEELGAPLP
jgi:hypothetical protein